MASNKGPQDPERTRRALLDAAAAEFSENGLQGGRIVQIARRAGTNVQAIYYHFGNKEQLYSAALDSLYEAEQFGEVYRALEATDPRDAIAALITFMFDRYGHQMGYHALLTEQDLHGARQLKNLPRVRALFATLIDKLQAVLDRGAAAGILDSGLDATRVYISITSLTGSYLHKMQTHAALLGRDFGAPEEFAAWREFVQRMVLAGLSPQAPEAAASTKAKPARPAVRPRGAAATPAKA